MVLNELCFLFCKITKNLVLAIGEYLLNLSDIHNIDIFKWYENSKSRKYT